MKKLSKEQHKNLLSCEVQLRDVFVMNYRDIFDTKETIAENGWKTGLWVWNGKGDKLINVETGEFLDQQVMDTYQFVADRPKIDLMTFRGEVGHRAINDSPFELPGADIPQASKLYDVVLNRFTHIEKEERDFNYGTILDYNHKASREFMDANTLEFSKEIIKMVSGEDADMGAKCTFAYISDRIRRQISEHDEILLSDAVQAMQNMRERAKNMPQEQQRVATSVSSLDF